MQQGSSKTVTPKHGLLDSSSSDHHSSRKHSVSQKIKEEEKSFTFSLNFFQKNLSNRKSTETMESEKILQDESSIAPQSFDSEKQSKRKIIYASESYQEQEEKQQLITTQSNNDLFSQIFLGKSKKNQAETKDLDPNNSQVFSKQKQPTTQNLNNSIAKEKQEIPEDPEVKISDFEVGKKLGAGKFGQVYLARHKASGFVCALKKIDKAKIDSKLAVQLLRQIKIQMFLNHPNIVKMFGFFSDADFIYLAMELCISGQLYTFLKKRRRVPEDMTRNIVSQTCRALDYMHENQIIHRDLKPQNIIYQCGLVKICDFGWSISTNTMRGTFCGTPLYVSPELLKRKNYNNKIDVWSVGILTYQLLFGKVPFEIQTEQDFIKIVQDEIKFSKITKISDEGKDFILNCLEKDPRDRYTVPELLEHPFLAKMENVSMMEMF